MAPALGRWVSIGAVAVLAVTAAAAGCHRGGSSTGAADAATTGTESPPLADLVRDAVAKGPPPGGEPPYIRPNPIDVPDVAAPDLGFLPRDQQGRYILSEQDGVRMTANPRLRNAVTAMGACISRVTRCMDPPATPGGRSLDACWAHVPRCATTQPWMEATACCPPRCAELYESLRTLGYPLLDAHDRTMESMCFNGLTQILAGS